MIRPNPLQWIWYAFGGRLGPLHSGWVLYDTTCRTRWLRQIVRAETQIVLPAAVVLAALGVSAIMWAGVGLGALLALWYSLAYIDQTGERRLVQHGYEPGTLKRSLRERVQREQADRIARYMEMYRT
jgi:formate hydrogenlyase subunit 3/multisubunit Na+/H+ antiporter MnhD subunit